MEYRKNEKGAALLLALGFAALLLVLVMGFVTNALIERKVASTNADRTEAKNIAMSALNRAIASMTFLSSTINEDTGIHRFDNIVSKNTENIYSVSSHHDAYITAIPSPLTSPYSGTQNFNAGDVPKFSGLNDIFVERTYNGQTHYVLKNGQDLYLYKYPVNLNYDYNENQNTLPSTQGGQELILVPRQPQWQYVRRDGFNPPWSASNPRSPVIGRFLYAVLPDMGKFSADAFRHNTRMSGSNITDSAIERKGREIREFSGSYFMPLMRAAFDSDVNHNYSADPNDILYYTNGEAFFRNSQAFDVVMRAGQVVASLSDSDIADSAFELSNMVEPLRFNINAAGTGLVSGNMNQNFRQGNSYTTHPMLSLLSPTGGINPNFPNALTCSCSNHLFVCPHTSSPHTTSRCPNICPNIFQWIPYLNKIDSNLDVRNQIAANIIEAINPQSGNVINDGNFASTTTYTGNRRTPYINEIEVQITGIRGNVNTVDNNDGTKTITVSSLEADVEVAVELYDPYNAGIGSSYSITPQISSFSLRFEPESGVSVDGTQTVAFSSLTFDNSYVPDPVDGLSVRRYRATVPGGTLKFSHGTDFVIKAVIEDFSANWTYTRDGEIVDFVKNLGSTGYSVNSSCGESAEYAAKDDNTFTAVTGSSVKIGSFQALDARANLDGSSSVVPLQWNQPQQNITTSNIGSANTGATVIGSRFIDTANLNDFSLADFGLISRGTPGNTLNIHSVNATNTNGINGTVNDITNPSGVSGSATSGDGGLLDQITTMVDSPPQLIDINTRSVAVWRSLLSNIHGDITTANPNPGVILSPVQAENLARKISYNIRDNNSFFKSRSGFIAVFNNSLGSVNGIAATTSDITGSPLSDREKQIILGKVLPLCKTEDYPEFIQVVVVAQKIKDIGGYVNDNPSNNFVVGENFGSFEYGRDQIVSEVRLLAKIRLTSTSTGNEFKIISIEELID